MGFLSALIREPYLLESVGVQRFARNNRVVGKSVSRVFVVVWLSCVLGFSPSRRLHHAVWYFGLPCQTSWPRDVFQYNPDSSTHHVDYHRIYSASPVSVETGGRKGTGAYAVCPCSGFHEACSRRSLRSSKLLLKEGKPSNLSSREVSRTEFRSVPLA